MNICFKSEPLRIAACIVLLACGNVAQAQTAPEPAPAASAYSPSATRVASSGTAIAPPTIEPAILTMVTLGNAGLLQSAFSLERQATSITRIGESRASIGYANATGIRTGYRYDDQALILPFSIIKSVPLDGAGVGFFRLAATGVLADSTKQVQWNDGNVARVDAQFIYAPTPSRFIGIGVIYQDALINNFYTPTSQSGTSDRSSWGGRLDYADKLTENFGLTARMQATNGDYIVKIPSASYLHAQNVTEYYAQSELVGTFGNSDSSLIPAGWVLHPIVGANFFYGQFQRTADSYGIVSGSVIGPGERYGTVWGDLRLEKGAAFTTDAQFLPFITVGLEREYVNNLNVLVKEPNYGRVSAGFAITAFGQRIDLAYSYRPGFTGRRTTQDLVIATSINF